MSDATGAATTPESQARAAAEAFARANLASHVADPEVWQRLAALLLPLYEEVDQPKRLANYNHEGCQKAEAEILALRSSLAQCEGRCEGLALQGKTNASALREAKEELKGLGWGRDEWFDVWTRDYLAEKASDERVIEDVEAERDAALRRAEVAEARVAEVRALWADYRDAPYPAAGRVALNAIDDYLSAAPQIKEPTK